MTKTDVSEKLTEKELLKLAKENDRSAFEELVRRNQAKIYNLGLKLLRNREDAADLLQETFIKAYNALSGFKEKSSFSTWLYRIATNFALMKMRKRKIKFVSLDFRRDDTGKDYPADIPDWSQNPKAHLENQELKRIIGNATDSLPDRYKTVFVLHDVEGFSTHDISRMMDISLSAVKSRIHRSRLFLRERLSQYFQAGIN